MVEDIVLLRIDFKGDTIQESSTVITTANAMITVNNIAGVINNNCADDVSLANNSYA